MISLMNNKSIKFEIIIKLVGEFAKFYLLFLKIKNKG